MISLVIDFSELSNIYFSISNLFIIKQTAPAKTKIMSYMNNSPRGTDALMLFTSGSAICHQQDCEPIFVAPHSLVYIPKGCKYIWESNSLSENIIQERILFEFILKYTKTEYSQDIKSSLSSVFTDESISFSDKIKTIFIEDFQQYKKAFELLLKNFSAKPKSPLQINYAAYKIFDLLSNRKNYNKHIYSKELKNIINYIDSNIENKITVDDLSKKLGISPSHFERIFKMHTGMSLMDYISSNKIYQIKKLLLENEFTLNQISERFNFCDTSYLCRFFKNKTGMTPSEYKNSYKNISL